MAEAVTASTVESIVVLGEEGYRLETVKGATRNGVSRKGGARSVLVGVSVENLAQPNFPRSHPPKLKNGFTTAGREPFLWVEHKPRSYNFWYLLCGEDHGLILVLVPERVQIVIVVGEGLT